MNTPHAPYGLKSTPLYFLAVLLLATISCSEDEPSVSFPDVTVDETWTSGFAASWTSQGNIAIQVSQSDDFATLVTDTTFTNTRSGEIHGLRSNQSYQVRFGFDGGTFSEPTALQTTELSAPGNVQVGTILGDEIHVDWNEVRGAVYELQVSTGPDFSSFVDGFDARVTSRTSFVIDPLDILTDYHIRIRSINLDTMSDWVALGTVTTTDDLVFTLRSEDFEFDGKIPSRYSCQSPSPEMNWKNVPDGTVTLAIVMIDLDFQNGFNHWILFNIPADISSIDSGETPSGSTPGTNDLGGRQYFGPCPPAGEEHRYIFSLYALDQELSVSGAIRNDDFLAEIDDKTIDTAILRAEYN